MQSSADWSAAQQCHWSPDRIAPKMRLSQPPLCAVWHSPTSVKPSLGSEAMRREFLHRTAHLIQETEPITACIFCMNSKSTGMQFPYGKERQSNGEDTEIRKGGI